MNNDTPYEYIDQVLGVRISFLISDPDIKHPLGIGYIKYCTLYKRLKSAHSCWLLLRRASRGKEALLRFDTLPPEVRSLLERLFPPPTTASVSFFDTLYHGINQDAKRYFVDFRYGIDDALPEPVQRLYANHATILDMVQECKTKRAGYAKAIKTGVDMWQSLSNDVNCFAILNHELPRSKDGLRRTFTKYLKEGYPALVSGKYGVSNALKVNAYVERIIVSLYCQPNNPFAEKVHKDWMDFVHGYLDVIDVKTGEIFDPEQCQKNGQPLELSDTTIWNILTKPENQPLIAKYRHGAHDYSLKQRPHTHRHKPGHGLSKISMDDRDIMHHKLPDGRRVFAYYAFDVLSDCIVGVSHGLEKNHDLILGCFRNMFEFLEQNNLGTPLEVEVEQHLMSDFKNTFLKDGVLFDTIRYCNGGNSQEKHAERSIGTKKYGVEKDNNVGVGRHYSRRSSAKVVQQKFFDNMNDTYKYNKAPYETIVANDYDECMQHNNQLHANQKKYPGMTKLDVLLHTAHPNAKAPHPQMLAKYLGNCTETSIVRNSYVKVQYEKFQISSAQVLSKLKPNNYKVQAYYMPNTNGIETVYLYQDDRWIDTAQRIKTFNTARAEWTEQDAINYQNATAYVAEFDKKVKEDTAKKVAPVAVMRKEKAHPSTSLRGTKKIRQERKLEVKVIEIEPETPEFVFVENNATSARWNAVNDL